MVYNVLIVYAWERMEMALKREAKQPFHCENRYHRGETGRPVRWKRIRYAALGDSFTFGYSGKKTEGIASYPRLIAEITGCRYTLLCTPGAAWAKRDGVTIPTMTDYARHISGDYDIITVYAGVNDRPSLCPNRAAGEVAWGTLGDFEETTFYGAIGFTLKALRLKYPYIPILVLIDTGNREKDEALQAAAEYFRMPALRLDKMGMNPPWLGEELRAQGKAPYYSDLLHPSREGHRMIARAVLGEMKKYINV